MTYRCDNCARETAGGEKFCCESCIQGIHSPECNKRTWPESRTAEYYDDPEAGVKLMERIQKCLALCNVVHKELMSINEAGRRFIPDFRDDIEHMLNHLHVDILYCETAARKLLKG